MFQIFASAKRETHVRDPSLSRVSLGASCRGLLNRLRGHSPTTPGAACAALASLLTHPGGACPALFYLLRHGARTLGHGTQRPPCKDLSSHCHFPEKWDPPPELRHRSALHERPARCSVSWSAFKRSHDCTPLTAADWVVLGVKAGQARAGDPAALGWRASCLILL